MADDDVNVIFGCSTSSSPQGSPAGSGAQQRPAMVICSFYEELRILAQRHLTPTGRRPRNTRTAPLQLGPPTCLQHKNGSAVLPGWGPTISTRGRSNRVMPPDMAPETDPTPAAKVAGRGSTCMTAGPRPMAEVRSRAYSTRGFRNAAKWCFPPVVSDSGPHACTAQYAESGLDPRRRAPSPACPWRKRKSAWSAPPLCAGHIHRPRDVFQFPGQNASQPALLPPLWPARPVWRPAHQHHWSESAYNQVTPCSRAAAGAPQAAWTSRPKLVAHGPPFRWRYRFPEGPLAPSIRNNLNQNFC